jgi:hypothetical protein
VLSGYQHKFFSRVVELELLGDSAWLADLLGHLILFLATPNAFQEFSWSFLFN